MKKIFVHSQLLSDRRSFTHSKMSFSAVTLLVGRQDGDPACKNGCSFVRGDNFTMQSFARIIAPVVTTTSITLSSNKVQNVDILVPANQEKERLHPSQFFLHGEQLHHRMKKAVREMQTLRGARNFRPVAYPVPWGAGQPKFNQLEMVTTFT